MNTTRTMDGLDASDPGLRGLAGAQHALSPDEIAIGVLIGRVSEYFDYFVYGFASVLVFPSFFFPFERPLEGTL